MSDKISVIIVNWNGEQFIERCLAALIDQTIKPHEIILVDNASPDNSLTIVQQFPSVRVMALNQNTGFAKGNNLAIAATSDESEWVALINPDAFLEPNWIETMLSAANHNPGFDMFASQLIDASNPLVLDGAGDAYHLSGLVWRTEHGLPVWGADNSEREIFSPCAAAALYRRSALRKVGGFDEDFFCYVEDVDLGFRLRLAGQRCLYVQKSVAYHVGSGTTGGRHSDFSVYHGHRNLVWTFVKNMPGVLFWMLVPLHIVLNVLTVAYFVLRGQGRVILRAKLDALKGLPRMWRKRREIQANRVATIGDIWRVLDKRIWLVSR